MDLKLISIGICTCIVLQTVLVLASQENEKDCRLCKPGYHASRMCSDIYDTVCKPCSSGTFTSVHNVFNKCSPCSKCGTGDFVTVECTRFRDTSCESCSAVSTDHASEHFIKACLTHDAPVDMRHIHDPLDIQLQHDEPITNIEGSGAIPDEIDESAYQKPIVNDIIDTVEGSGEVPVIDETDITTRTSVILTGDEDEDKKVTNVTVSYNVTEISASTTSTPAVIIVDGGIQLSNATTTQKSIVIGGGIKLAGESTQTPVIDVDVYVKSSHETEDDEITGDNPQSGASKKEKDGGSGGASIGVVVTVGLVAALIFFVFGFLASRYWSSRRDRTFNVLEAERLNGKAPVECSGIAYKDPENNIPAKSSVYDEIPADSKVKRNGAEPQAPRAKPATNPDPVYSKPIKRNSGAPDTAQSPPKNEPETTDEKWAGFSLSRNPSSGSIILQPEPAPAAPAVRPTSEIKYIDEEEAETDRLLPASTTSSSDSDATPSSDVTSDESFERKSDSDNPSENPSENTPMIRKGSS